MWTKILNSFLYVFVVVFTSCKPFKKNELNLQIDNIVYIEITKKKKSIYKTKDKEAIQNIINKMNYAKPVFLKVASVNKLLIYGLDSKIMLDIPFKNKHFMYYGKAYETNGDFPPVEK